MIERPILFSTSMVVAVMGLFKTQTRRLTGLDEINKDPDRYIFRGFYHLGEDDLLHAVWEDSKNWGTQIVIKCPYGKPKDQLWIREAFSLDGDRCLYRADYDDQYAETIKWKPSIHIFRKHSRTDLLNINIRVERLNDISEEDAKAEGVLPNCLSAVFKDGCWIIPENTGCPAQANIGCSKCEGEWMKYPLDEEYEFPAFSAKESFQSLWDSIHGSHEKGKPDCSWNANPFVWVVDFKKL
jgi:hypothetical protein